jgi:hypothetical protein
MKINPYDENAFKLDHPRGTVSLDYLLSPGAVTRSSRSGCCPSSVSPR